MILALIGLRASGKTTAGRLLAARLNCPFIDLDDAVIARLGCATISEAWSRSGEAGFRAAEAAALHETLRKQDPATNLVLALGGGTPMLPTAAPALQTCRVIYLRARADTLASRLAHDPGDRPSLTGAGPTEEAQSLHAIRDPVYQSLAAAVIDVDGLTVQALVDQLALLGRPASGGA